MSSFGRIGQYNIHGRPRREFRALCYPGHDLLKGRDVTIKVLSSDYSDDPKSALRLQSEAQILAALNHPNIVTIHELGEEDGAPYVALEALDGITLEDALEGRIIVQQALAGGASLEQAVDGRISIRVVLGIILQVLEGLAHAHRVGVVHRDIRPANIFIQAKGPVKITGFGLARLVRATTSEPGEIAGTADYMSPEQLKGLDVDGRSDVFSVGCTLYEMLVGRPPFHAKSVPATFHNITHDEPPLEQIPPGPQYAALLPVLGKSLAKAVEDRYPDAPSMALDLHGVLASLA